MTAILPGATIGIVGGGQLGRMLALEARRMGYRTAVLDPMPDGPAAQVTDFHFAAALDDADALRRLAERSDVVTCEWENADVGALREAAGRAPLRPGPEVLAIAQHRAREKDAIRALGIPTAEYRPVGSEAQLRRALAEIGVPAVLKTARGGYDGLGQARIRAPDELGDALALVADGGECVLEGWVPFRMEVSVVCARSPSGGIAAFPAAENVHRDGILDLTVVPARVPPAVAAEAVRITEAVAEGLGVVGVLAVEMFVTPDDRVLVNEIAPRPHNSGHFTWEACAASQFEQQLRAVCGLPLGSGTLLRPAAMANLLGRHLPDGWQARLPRALAGGDVALHIYDKDEARPGRKMGHLTALGAHADAALDRVVRARRAICPDA